VSPGESGASIDELLDRAVRAPNEGDRATATTLAGQVLSVDQGISEAEDLLSPPTDNHVRRPRLSGSSGSIGPRGVQRWLGRGRRRSSSAG
jgi:hypothetical protein